MIRYMTGKIAVHRFFILIIAIGAALNLITRVLT